MKVDVLQSNLVSGLERIVRGLPRSKWISLQDCVRLTAHRGRLEMAANAENHWITYIGARIHQEGVVCIPARELLSFAKTFKKDTRLTLGWNEEGTFEVSSEDNSMGFEHFDVANFPHIRWVEDVDKFCAFAMTGAFFKAMMKRIEHAGFNTEYTREKPGSPRSYRAAIFNLGDKVDFLCCDTYRMALETVNANELVWGGGELSRQWTVPINALNHFAASLAKSTKKGGHTMVYFGFYEGDSRLVLEEGSTQYQIYCDNSGYLKFPDQYRDMIPISETSLVTVRRVRLLEALQRAAAHDDEYTKSVRITFDGGLTLKAKNSAKKEFEERIACLQSGEVLSRTFQTSYLIDALKSIDCETTEMLLERFTYKMTNWDTDKVEEKEGIRLAIRNPERKEKWVFTVMPMSDGRD